MIEDLVGFSALAGLFAAFFLVMLIIAIGLYVYISFAYMAIAKKAKQKSPALAWIPYVGPIIIAYKASKMDWWPWLLIAGFFIPFINILAMLVFGVFVIIWHWKLFEKVGRPGWLAILGIIPVVNLIIIGIVAWGKK